MFTATRPADHVPMLHVQIVLIKDQVTRLQIHYLTDKFIVNLRSERELIAL